MPISPDYDARADLQRAKLTLQDGIIEIERILARKEYDFAFVLDQHLPVAQDFCDQAHGLMERANEHAAKLTRPTFDFLPAGDALAVAESQMGRAVA